MKTTRQEKIIELISKYEIETQDELAERLTDEGFNVTQATVSRDIRELKLTKISTESGKQKYAIFQSPLSDMAQKYERVLKDGFMSVDSGTHCVGRWPGQPSGKNGEQRTGSGEGLCAHG